MDAAIPLAGLLGVVIAGFVWGRISARLAIPEWLRLMTTPLWTGALTVILAWFVSGIRLDWTAPRLVAASKLGVLALAHMAFGYGLFCFIVGAVLGLPASIGWVIGYRPPVEK